MGRVSGKVVIITGAGSGIGEACMELFAAEGAVVVGVGRREKNLQVVLEKVEASGGQGSIIPADLSDYDLAKGVVEKTVQDHGRVGFFVHNAYGGWGWGNGGYGK